MKKKKAGSYIVNPASELNEIILLMSDSDFVLRMEVERQLVSIKHFEGIYEN